MASPVVPHQVRVDELKDLFAHTEEFPSLLCKVEKLMAPAHLRSPGGGSEEIRNYVTARRPNAMETTLAMYGC